MSMSYQPQESSSTQPQTILEQTKDLVTDKVEEIKETISTATSSSTTTTPEPPHGVPPTNTNPKGTVAHEDKSFTLKLGDNWEYLKSTYIGQSVTDTLAQAQIKLGLPHYIAPGVIPPPPRGTPPSDQCQLGRVAESDKSLQTQIEDNYNMLRSEFTGLVTRGQRKLGFNYSNQPGGIPEPPYGTPPSDSGKGFVDERDKTIGMQLYESMDQLVEEAISGIKSLKEKALEVVSVRDDQMEMTTMTKAVATPEPPHGMPPSEGEKGFVAEQDKSIGQKVGEGLEMVKDVTQEKMGEAKQGLQDLTNLSMASGFL